MRTNRPSFLLVFALIAPFVARVSAAQGGPKADHTTTATTTVMEHDGDHKRSDNSVAADAWSESSIAIGGKSFAYKAVAGLLTVGGNEQTDAQLATDGKWLPEAAGDMPAKLDDQPPTARMFYTAYFAKGTDEHTRPVMFIYNGGPGSATMYLRMSSIGPVRVQLQDTLHPKGGPYTIVPNQYSLLDATDLVFIDAPGTGYSRVMGKDGGKSFYGVDEDAGAFDRFIRRFLSKYNRWTSPRFLFGESYGTTRDAVLAARLKGSGVDLNGVIFLSQILSFNNSADGSDGNPGTENGFFLAFPSFAATAWYHHKLAGGAQPELQGFLHEVEAFSLGEYASALLQGADLTADRKAAVAAKLEGYTGVPAATWIKANLRLTGGEFSKFLQEGAGITTGRLDSRYEGPVMDPLERDATYDPFTESVDSAILAAMNEYAHNTLHFGQEMTYKPSARGPGFDWNMKHRSPGGGWPGTYTNVMPDLAYVMKQNPRMEVLLMGGYFDLGTLYFGATYEMKHLPMPQALQANIKYRFFPTGHMVYVNEGALRDLHDATADFIRKNQDGVVR